MSLKTHSKFYFGFAVTADNFELDFKEGTDPERTAELDLQTYTLTDFVAAISSALNATGDLDYSVSLNRSTRVVTVTASGPFTILAATGSHAGTSAWPLAGFAADTGSATSHAGVAAGQSYSTQFILQSYISPEDYQDQNYGTVNKSASGNVEVISYGVTRYIQAEIKYVNNYTQGSGGPIRNNPAGIEDLRTFMRYLVTKGPLEFMEDENTPGTFFSVSLESTPDDQKGLKYKLQELYTQGLPGYFNTGNLLFRVRED